VIGTTGYNTLEEAVANAVDGNTIKLLKNSSGNGIVFPESKFNTNGVVIDLNGFTYTFSGNPVGSAGTETIGFQLLKGNKITFQNGTIDVAAVTTGSFKRVFQSYADVTFNNVTVDGTNLVGNNAANEFCNGNVKISGSSSFNSKSGVAAINVDQWNGFYPDGAQVTINTTGTINGINCYTEGTGTTSATKLEIQAGTITALTVEEGCEVPVTKAAAVTVAAPTGYHWIDNKLVKDCVVKFYTEMTPEAAQNPDAGKEYTALRQSVASDGTHTATQPTGTDVPTIKGYTLDKWYVLKNGAFEQYNFTTPVTGDLNLFAHFARNYHDVIFDANEGAWPDGVSPVPGEDGKIKTSVGYGLTTDPATPTDMPSKTGYTFDGFDWTYTEEGEDPQSGNTKNPLTPFPETMPNADVNAVAKWDANKYAIYFNPNDGAEVPNPLAYQTITYGAGDTLQLFATTFEGRTYAGHTFKEWNTLATPTDQERGTAFADGAAVPDSFYKGAWVNRTLYAQYEANTFTIAFDSNGGSTVASIPNVSYDAVSVRNK
jgi:uncharacterized repeat protein (TIGR02543 family)